jgi:hypothetical protein
LTGRPFALHSAALKDKSDKNLKGAASAFTIGTILHPGEMPLIIAMSPDTNPFRAAGASEQQRIDAGEL